MHLKLLPLLLFIADAFFARNDFDRPEMPKIMVTRFRTITSTVYQTATEILLTGTFIASNNIVQITNKKGSPPEFFLTNNESMETWSQTWRVGPTITTTTVIFVGIIHLNDGMCAHAVFCRYCSF